MGQEDAGLKAGCGHLPSCCWIQDKAKRDIVALVRHLHLSKIDFLEDLREARDPVLLANGEKRFGVLKGNLGTGPPRTRVVTAEWSLLLQRPTWSLSLDLH